MSDTGFFPSGDGGAVLTVWGELDVAVATRFESAIASLLATHPGDTMWLDMDRVTFIDSSGLGVLVRAQKQAGGPGGSIAIRNLQPAVYKVFEITGLRAMFGID